PETATLQERYHSILQNCRRLNGINVLLKRSILDNWVENYRMCWRIGQQGQRNEGSYEPSLLARSARQLGFYPVFTDGLIKH
ncbi:hypothetical protein WG929_16430, partial [Oceanobacter sp. wDCs-4]